MSRQINHFIKHGIFKEDSENEEKIIKQRYVEILNFSLMPNHFHLTLCEIKEGGIAQYMQRVLCAYTKYFNTKYKKSGHLFQGPYKAVHVSDNKQLLYLSTYIHKNPREILNWKGKEDTYPWSSYQDYVNKNRWGKLLSRDLILEQYSKNNDYHEFVKSSTAKELKENLKEESIFDI